MNWNEYFWQLCWHIVFYNMVKFQCVYSSVSAEVQCHLIWMSINVSILYVKNKFTGIYINEMFVSIFQNWSYFNAWWFTLEFIWNCMWDYISEAMIYIKTWFTINRAVQRLPTTTFSILVYLWQIFMKVHTGVTADIQCSLLFMS